MKIAAALVLLLGALSTGALQARTLEGKVVGVSDGDTLTLLVDRKPLKIRLARIDAPETGKGQKNPGMPYGEAARQALAKQVFQKTVRAECPNSDHYGRHVCEIFVDGKNINLEQVRQGMAWAYKQYAKNPAYFEAQKLAQAQRLGLWKDAHPQAPWEWRKEKKRLDKY